MHLLPMVALAMGCSLACSSRPRAEGAPVDGADGSGAVEQPRRPDTSLLFIPGVGIEHRFSLGDPDSKFVEYLGAENLTAEEVGGPGFLSHLREVAYTSKDGLWLVTSLKATRAIDQIFYCGMGWHTQDGFSPIVPFSRHKKFFGPKTCELDTDIRGTKGIGFGAPVAVIEADDNGVDQTEKGYQCVTVFKPHRGCLDIAEISRFGLNNRDTRRLSDLDAVLEDEALEKASAALDAEKQNAAAPSAKNLGRMQGECNRGDGRRCYELAMVYLNREKHGRDDWDRACRLSKKSCELGYQLGCEVCATPSP